MLVVERIAKGIGFLFGAIVLTAVGWQTSSFTTAVCLGLVATVGICRPLPDYGLGRIVGLCLAMFAALSLFNHFDTMEKETQARLAMLRSMDPDAYLVEARGKVDESDWLKAAAEINPTLWLSETRRLKGDEAWLAALQTTDPAAYAVERRKYEEEQARLKSEAQRLEAERIRKEAEAAARRKVQEAEKAQVKLNEQYNGRHCLSAWDGSPRSLVKAVKRSLGRPGSFEYLQSAITPRDQNGQHEVRMRYRAENVFGGMSIAKAAGTIRSADCSLVSWHSYD